MRVSCAARRRSGSRSAAAMAVACVLLAACGDWFTTFKDQPAIHPWEAATMAPIRLDSVPPRANPQGSVPIRGGGPPNWIASYGSMTPEAEAVLAALSNPNPPTDESIANGHRQYQINCAVCHGDLGAGDGPITTLGWPGIRSLLADQARGRSDGYIYGMIRNGFGAMPSYVRIEHFDRWDIVNYVRGLQGVLGRAVPTGKLGIPGETGASVPGPSRTAPQLPVPHFPPARIGGGG